MDVNWIAGLVRCKDGKNFEVIGNPFQVKEVSANAAASAAPAKDLLQLSFAFGNAASCFAGMSGG